MQDELFEAILKRIPDSYLYLLSYLYLFKLPWPWVLDMLPVFCQGEPFVEKFLMLFCLHLLSVFITFRHVLAHISFYLCLFFSINPFDGEAIEDGGLRIKHII